ncbi:MAG: hypothetical protein CML01_00500 [Pseudomonas sp.]|nr:hypothetical protein [Pseudomonas sp.]|tara:strand:+ start:3170 stop:3412 length:243 start_codon:yes stop_codon:yes gene_type:complete
MRTVSFQGTQLSKSQRDRLAFQQQTRAGFLNNHLQQQVDETLAALQARKEQGTPPVKPERKWFLEYQAKGTPCVAELFGF